MEAARRARKHAVAVGLHGEAVEQAAQAAYDAAFARQGQPKTVSASAQRNREYRKDPTVREQQAAHALEQRAALKGLTPEEAAKQAEQTAKQAARMAQRAEAEKQAADKQAVVEKQALLQVEHLAAAIEAALSAGGSMPGEEFKQLSSIVARGLSPDSWPPVMLRILPHLIEHGLRSYGLPASVIATMLRRVPRNAAEMLNSLRHVVGQPQRQQLWDQRGELVLERVDEECSDTIQGMVQLPGIDCWFFVQCSEVQLGRDGHTYGHAPGLRYGDPQDAKQCIGIAVAISEQVGWPAAVCRGQVGSVRAGQQAVP